MNINLECARGNGTNMITFIMAPKSKISDYNKKLIDGIGCFFRYQLEQEYIYENVVFLQGDDIFI